MRKLFVPVLVICILCNAVCSCGSDKDDAYDATAWYDSVRLHFVTRDTNCSWRYYCSDDENIILGSVNDITFDCGVVKVTRTGKQSEPIFCDGYDIVDAYIKNGYHCLLRGDDLNYYDGLLDFDEETVTDIVPVDYNTPSGRTAFLIKTSIVGSHVVTLLKYFDYAGNNDTYAIKIDDDIYELYSAIWAFYVVDGGDGCVYVAAGDDEVEDPEDEYRRKYIRVDIDSGEMEDIIVRDGDLLRKYFNEWPDAHPDRLIRVDDKTHLAYLYDPATDTERVIFDMQKFSVSINTMLAGIIVSSDPEHPVVWGPSPAVTGGLNLLLYALNRRDDDPTANKQVLTIKHIDGKDGYNTCSEAVYEFNRTNPDYYIKLAGDENELFGEADALTEMISEIRGGTAPDILIGYGKYSVINNSDYLQDMSGYINTDDLFVSSVNPDSEGVIRIVPLRLAIKAVITEPSYLIGTGNGFTVDDYIDFVGRLPNAVDPMVGCGQYRIWYFKDLLLPCFDCLFDDAGNFNADNETFRRIAEYSARLPEQTSNNYSANAGLPANVVWCDLSNASNSDMADAYSEPDPEIVMVGAPTAAGIGFAASERLDDVCVTVCCEHPEGAGQFIDFLTSTDIQNDNTSCSFPNNKASFEYLCDYNRVPSRLREQAYDALGNISFFITEDPELMKIIEEEIQPYFEGQKTLDQVIVIINSRAGNLLSEREF